MDRSRPIGVFDSGVGGLSLLRVIRERWPNEDLTYVADSVHAPYGDRDSRWIEQRSSRIIAFLVEQGCKAVVIACNTVTAVAVAALRETFDIPIIAIEPAIKPAVMLTRSGVVAVLATTRTLNSESLQCLRERVCGEVEVIFVPCPGLAQCVEEADLDSQRVTELLTDFLSPAMKAGADILVLGCTHYPFLTEAIQRVVGSSVSIIDPSVAVAEELGRRLDLWQRHSPQTRSAVTAIWSSADVQQAKRVTRSLLGYELGISLLPELDR